MVALSFLSLLLATTTLAAPSQRKIDARGHCSRVPASAFNLPQSFSSLTSPPRYTTMGFGIQNYTCSDSGTYTSIGAIGQMFDVSCLYDRSKQEFSSIQEDAFQFWTQQQGNDPLGKQVAQEVKQKWNIDVIGQHYFVEENNQLVPVFDFSSTGRHKGDSKAIFFGKKTEDVPSPDGNDNVDWLELQNVSGELASTIYRVYTVKGQPPAKCDPGSNISIKYSTLYLLTQ